MVRIDKKVWHRLRPVISLVALVLVAASPFIVYEGAHAARTKPLPVWPHDTAVVTSSAGQLVDVALLHFPTPPRTDGAEIMRLPLDATLDAPNAGRLRIETAFKVGGAHLVAEALDNSLETPVPFWIDAEPPVSGARKVVASNAGDHLRQLVQILDGGVTSVIDAPGKAGTEGVLYTFALDFSSMNAMLSGSLPWAPLPTPTPTPTPTFGPTPSPEPLPKLDQASQIPNFRISVAILNRNSSADNVDLFYRHVRSSGFNVRPPANTNVGPRIKGLVVYYRSSRTAAAEVARALGVDSISRLPGGFPRSTAVVVVVGS